MESVVILGSTGMLGSTLTRYMERVFPSVTELNRMGKSVTGRNRSIEFDVLKDNNLVDKLNQLKPDYIINAIGMIKQLIDEQNEEDIEKAQKINADFSETLNHFALTSGIRVIQIGTDCVYSGKKGSYSEISSFDPLDTYGVTKLAGEYASTESMILRCSVIGRELHSSISLMEWVLSQPLGAVINGFNNHIWNGVTTLQFAEVVSGIIRSGSFTPGVQHLVPTNAVSKYDLIRLIARDFGRSDLSIIETKAQNDVDRSLITVDSARNLHMWQAGGYNKVPTIKEMVSKYARWTETQ